MKNFKDIVDLTFNRIDETIPDDQITMIVKAAINHAYQSDLSKLDRRLTKAFCSVVDGVAELPDDIRTIIKITPKLEDGEYRIGNSIISDRDVEFEILYTIAPGELVKDTDVPDISQRLWYLLSTYACYAYYSYRRKTPVAQGYMQEYEMGKSDYINESDNVEEYVQDVYKTVGGDE
jgi:hypothetical protein